MTAAPDDRDRTAGPDEGRDAADPDDGRRAAGPDERRRLDAVLRDMVDRMAHELKNPLQAIIVNAEVVRVRAPDRREGAGGGEGEPEALEPFLSAIEKSVERLDRHLRLLILVARSATEGVAPAAPLDLAGELVGALRLDSGSSPVVVEPPPEREGPTVPLRAGRFLACLLRLLERARARADGPVRVRCAPDGRSLEVRWEEAGAEDAAGAGATSGAAEASAPDATSHADEASRAERMSAAEAFGSEVRALARSAGLDLDLAVRDGRATCHLRFPRA